ncbi:MAG: hypothetical protein ACWA47_00145 [Brevirhabdus sp.]
MKRFFPAAIVAALTLGTPAISGPIENACLKAGRKAANRALCACIQDAANATLSRSEQKRAAKFFRDPHKAQETRQSDRSSDERFWQAYKNFGTTAQNYCES